MTVPTSAGADAAARSAWGWQAPGKGCSLGAGAEAWPGSQPCPQLSMAFLPGSINTGTRGRALYAPPKPLTFPTLIASPPLPAQDPGQAHGALCACYIRLHGSLEPWDTPPLILISVIPSRSLSVVTFSVGPSLPLYLKLPSSLSWHPLVSLLA